MSTLGPYREQPGKWSATGEKNKLELFRITWRENTLSYRKALKTSRSAYFTSFLEEKKHNPKYLFNTVAKLTKNMTSASANITQQHSSNDFMNYFNNKFLKFPFI